MYHIDAFFFISSYKFYINCKNVACFFIYFLTRKNVEFYKKSDLNDIEYTIILKNAIK